MKYSFCILMVNVLIVGLLMAEQELVTISSDIDILQGGIISGKIQDLKFKTPLQGVNISIVGTRYGAISDNFGHFSIKSVPVGFHKVRISLLGYKTQIIEVNVETDKDTVLDIMLEEDDAIILEEITIKANRINVYPQIEFDAKAEGTLGDIGELFREIPGGSSIRKSGIALDPVIRGFRGEQLNVIVDGGLKIWGACPNRMDPPTSHLESGDVEKVEVIKGPFSVRYGPTLGAVVNLVMKKVEQKRQPAIHTLVEGGYESNWDGKRVRASLNANTGLNDLYVSGGLKTFGSYCDGDGKSIESRFRLYDYSFKMGFNFVEKHRVQFTHRGSFMRDVHYPALPMDAYLDDAYIFAIDYAARSVSNTMSSISFKSYVSLVDHIMGNQWKPTYTLLHAKTDVSAKTMGGRTEFEIIPMSGLICHIGMDGYLTTKTGDRFRNFVSGQNAGKEFIDTIWQDASIQDIGSFIESRWFPNKFLTTVFGLRFDHICTKILRPNAYYSQNFPNNLRSKETDASGVFSVMSVVSPVINLRFGLGYGFRVPDITERFAYILPIGMDRYDYIGNPLLKSERNIQIELTTEINSSEFTCQTSLFNSKLRNFISSCVDTSIKKLSPDALGVKRFVNISNAVIRGIEFKVTGKLISDVIFELTTSYMHGNNKEYNEPLPEMPPLTISSLFRYQPDVSRYWVELHTKFSAKQTRVSKFYQENETPSFVIISCLAGVKIIECFNITIGIKNIFNRTYYEHLNRKNRLDHSPIMEPGRVIYANFRFEY